MGITRQALLHHFGTKERLYGEVLSRLADGISGVVARTGEEDRDPGKHLHALFRRICDHALDRPEETLLLMRELTDNSPRAELAKHWYLTNYLNSVVSLLRDAAGREDLSEAEALARVYAIFGAINYFAVSGPTLKQMFGDQAFAALSSRFPAEVERLVQSAIAGT